MWTSLIDGAAQPRRWPLPVVLVALAAAGCWSRAPAQRVDTNEATMTVLVYSGRPNPSGTLDDATLTHIRELLAAGTTVERPPGATVMPGKLGYNGIVVQNPAGRGSVPRQVIIYGKDIETRNGTVRFLRDPTAALEQFLLNRALERKIVDRQTLQAARGGTRTE